MFLLDERGRLFGKFNIIDLFIILTIILVVTVLFIVIYKIGGGKEQQIIIYLKIDKAPLDLEDSIKEGFVEKRGNEVVAEILEIERSKVDPISQTNDLILKIRLVTNLNRNTLFYANTDIKVGTKRSFTFGPADLDYGFVWVTGTITRIEEEPLNLQKENKTIILFIGGENKELIDSLHVGDELLDEVGEVKGKITSLTHKPREFVYVFESTKEVSILQNPLYYDFLLIIELEAKVLENIYVFNDQKVAINYKLSFNTKNHVYFEGEVLDIR